MIEHTNNIHLVHTIVEFPSLIVVQLAKHIRTVCTHQMRECDFKDIGCYFKVSVA